MMIMEELRKVIGDNIDVDLSDEKVCSWNSSAKITITCKY